MRAVYNIRRIKRQGRKDGLNWRWKFWPFIKETKPVTPEDNCVGIAPFERELKEGIEDDIAKIAAKWEEIDRELKQKFCQAEGEYEQAKLKLGKEKKEAIEARNKFMTASDKLVKIGKPQLSPGWKYFWLILLGLSEFPLNGIVFSIFGAGRIETYVMAASLCIVIPILAHFAGMFIRKENKKEKDKILSFVLCLIAFLAFIVIAIMRADYLAEALKEFAPNLSPKLAAFIFVVINMLIFVGATLISYEGSHPRPDEYKNIYNEYKSSLKSYAKEDKEAKQAAKEFTRINAIFQKARIKREKTFSIYKKEADEKAAWYEWAAQAYRAENARARGKIIKCFEGQIKKADIPASLKENSLDWQCGRNENKTSE
jgi:hypothetical protein